MNKLIDPTQGAKKVIFTCPNVISTSPPNFLMSTVHSSSVSCIPQKKATCPSGKLRTEFTSPKPKSTSPGLSDMTFFVRWMIRQIF